MPVLRKMPRLTFVKRGGFYVLLQFYNRKNLEIAFAQVSHVGTLLSNHSLTTTLSAAVNSPRKVAALPFAMLAPTASMAYA